MRRTVSFLLASMMVASSVPAVSAQKINIGRKRQLRPQLETPAKRPPKTVLQSRETKFQSAEASTQGNGVWVHWKMDAEYENPGFTVYRIDGNGERPVSEFLPGSQFRYGDVPTYGESYSFFDAGGTAGSIYFIETAGTESPKRTGTFGVDFVKQAAAVEGENRFDFSSGMEQRSSTTTDLSMPSELRSEVESNQFQSDPSKHKEVISQPGARISAKGDGLIRVTKAQLQAAGFDVNSNPVNWQLFVEGVELPILIGPNVDYVEFIGRALDTIESDVRVYYLISGAQQGKRIRASYLRPTAGTLASKGFAQSTVKRERIFYFNQVLNGPLENFFGNVVGSGGTAFNFTLTGVDLTAGNATVTVALQGFSNSSHSVQITLNGNALTPVTGFSRDVMSKTYSVPASYLVEGVNALHMQSGANSDTSLFSYVSIDFKRKYIAEANRLDFFTENYKVTRMSGFSSPNIRLFDMTNESAPVEVVGARVTETGGSFGPVIPANRSRLYYATEATNVTAPVSVTPNDPALLSVPGESGQFVIIAHPSLMAEAQTWANYRSGQGIITKVVNVDEIFDEFSYGVSSSFAIEAFLMYARNNWLVKPDYVMLIGDASYDPKNYLGQGSWNMVPTRMVSTLFEETGSDEALADFNNDGLAEIAIGRISARDGQSVSTVFNKTVTWESGLGPNSLDRGALFAFDQPDGYDFEAMSGRLMNKLPTAMPKTTVKRGVPDGGTAQTAVISALNSGKYIANYSGHGTAGAWGGADFFSNLQMGSLTNANTPIVVTALTCLNAYFVSPGSQSDSLAERITKAPNGGAVAIWASTGRTTPDIQEVMALRFFEKVGDGSIPRLGDLIKDAKAQLIAGGDVRLSWTLIGDPMLKMR